MRFFSEITSLVLFPSSLVLCLLLSCLSSIYCLLSSCLRLVNDDESSSSEQSWLGVIHPWAAAGGGGEEVLFAFLSTLLSGDEKTVINKIFLLCGPQTPSWSELKLQANSRWGIEIRNSNSASQFNQIEVILLKCSSCWLVKGDSYSHFNLLFQSLGNFILGAECSIRLFWQVLLKSSPKQSTPKIILADTMGVSHAILSARLSLPQIVPFATSYTHYPFINLSGVSGARMANQYYQFYFSVLNFFYKLAGQAHDIAVCNSTFTFNQIQNNWTRCRQVERLFPPVSVKFRPAVQKEDILSFFRDQKTNRRNLIVSVAQFRPEKRQKLQLEIFQKLLQRNNVPADIRLIILGSTRSAEDLEYAYDLAHYAKEDLKLKTYIKNFQLEKEKDLIYRGGGLESIEWEKGACRQSVEFYLNVPKTFLDEILNSAVAGLHTMWSEHFGISIVEFLAHHLIVVADNSGGPRLDILCSEKEFQNDHVKMDVQNLGDFCCNLPFPVEDQRLGYLCSNADEYVDALYSAIVTYPLHQIDKYDESFELNEIQRMLTAATHIFKNRFLSNENFGRALMELWGLGDRSRARRESTRDKNE